MDHPAFYVLATIVVIVILYIMVSLAYMQKRKKAFFSMQEELKPGAEVLVANAIYGKVVELKADRVRVEIGDRLIITADRAAVFGRPDRSNGEGRI